MNACRFAIPALIAAAAHAQTGTYTWQVSADNGATWNSNVTPTPGATVNVRLLAGWAGVIGTNQGYSGGQFDAVAIGAGAANTVSNILRPNPFAFSAQTLIASTYDGGVKIDIVSDLAAPGLGTGWVNPGQADGFPGFGFNSNNPAIIFSYDIIAHNLSLTIGMVLNSMPARAMAIYNSASGAQVRMNASQVSVVNAFIVPSPTSLALLAFAGIASAHRRRSRSDFWANRRSFK